MTIQIPESVQWLVPIVVGTNWPEGDEDALRRLAQAWDQAATALGAATGAGHSAAQAALSAMQGETAEAFSGYWERFVAGDEQFLIAVQQACQQLATGCDEAALNIEYTKLSIIAALLILAAQIATMLAAAWVTGGASTAGVPLAQAATRISVQAIFQELNKQIVTNGGINVAVDSVIQGLQMVRGNRESWDLGRTMEAGIAGTTLAAAAGGLRLGGCQLGTTTANFSEAMLRGAGEGALAGAAGNYLYGLRHGDVVPAPENLASGAISGSVGGALGETANRHRGLDETWSPPGTSEYLAGPSGPNTVYVEDDDYLLPTTLHPPTGRIAPPDLPEPEHGRDP